MQVEEYSRKQPPSRGSLSAPRVTREQRAESITHAAVDAEMRASTALLRAERDQVVHGLAAREARLRERQERADRAEGREVSRQLGRQVIAMTRFHAAQASHRRAKDARRVQAARVARARQERGGSRTKSTVHAADSLATRRMMAADHARAVSGFRGPGDDEGARARLNR